jgi:predicted PurR-regulated permease PerM
MSVNEFFRGGPFRVGFLTTLGVLLALIIGSSVVVAGDALALIFAAFFISFGLFPVVRWLQKKGFSTSGAVLTVSAVFIVFVALLVGLIVPVIVNEAYPLIASLPSQLHGIEEQVWFIDLDHTLGGTLHAFLEWVQGVVADPNFWLTIGGGALHIGTGLVTGAFGGLFVIILTLYFVAALPTIKQGLYSLVSASKRPVVEDLAEQIAESVGKYLGGMAILAVINAAFTFILLTILGSPYAALLAVIALPLTLIPLVGSVISTTIVVIVALFTSPTAGIIALIAMVIYMQVEAYVLTPRIAGRAIKVPAYLVLIGALLGGTLLGLLGVLIACPVTASILLITRAVVTPKQNLK